MGQILPDVLTRQVVSFAWASVLCLASKSQSVHISYTLSPGKEEPGTLKASPPVTVTGAKSWALDSCCFLVWDSGQIIRPLSTYLSFHMYEMRQIQQIHNPLSVILKIKKF